MRNLKLHRITTIPLSLEKLLEGQLAFINNYYAVTAISSQKERLQEFGKKEGVPIFHIKLTRKITPISDLKAVIKLYKYLKKEKPTIVHTHTPKAGIVGMMAAYMAKVPLRLHTVAGLPLLEANGFKRFILNTVEKRTYHFATNVYPNSKGLKEIILESKFTSESKLKILGAGSSNGIDTSYFSKNHFSEKEIIAKKKELKIPSTDFVFVFVGRLVKDKGINELVAAFNRLKGATLLLVGPFEEDLNPISASAKDIISENPKIITTGFQEDVRIYYALSDALVFPSYREGFPNVVMQAGAMGLPSIVSDINGCNEIIKEGENGWIIPVKNEDAIFNAMQNCIIKPQEVAALASNSRQQISSRYEQKVVWKAILEEYQRLTLELER